MITIQVERCTGCGDCVAACANGAIRLIANAASIDQERCIECEACVAACPSGAIVAMREPMPMPVARPAPAIIQARPVAVPALRRTALLPALGAVLAFAGREIVPRLKPYVLDLLEQRVRRPPPALPSGAASLPSGGRRLCRRRRGS